MTTAGGSVFNTKLFTLPRIWTDIQVSSLCQRLQSPHDTCWGWSPSISVLLRQKGPSGATAALQHCQHLP